MTGKERVRLALAHREADRVPIWELGFHNAVARRIMGREVRLTRDGGPAGVNGTFQSYDAGKAKAGIGF